ncbi:MAG: 6-pyruvoyltetrahydropterin/6-carboxytetrahydropterin synthase [Desulfonauticus sp.]|jgi:6-pyruvoyltetrahydropterin/6-carboxytetrahydropterin synthase|nr:MAG: 6-carboxy-5,6,7,8-tetrahydropterin synthase [Desulfonauticus sp. 38_4375]MDK2920493.1 6-pyruvoyltetrahydropterin/6-carboxytetrahydropterin synthase [Desulfonauticus sp.]
MDKRYRLRIKDKFSAAHSLRNYEGSCENVHGHNFGVEIEVYGYSLEKDTEILIDFKVLKRKLKNILMDLDHKFLNELDFFRVNNPSSENIAKFIFFKLKETLPQNISLSYVMVSESDNSQAFYEEV